MAPAPRYTALRAFAIYLAGGLFLGETFPFSRYSMYADVAPRDVGVLPLFLADGAPADPRAFGRFHDVDPAAFTLPEGVAGTLGYLTRARAAWVGAHPADTPGPIRITVGYELIHLQDGHLVREAHPLDEGTAWPLDEGTAWR